MHAARSSSSKPSSRRTWRARRATLPRCSGASWARTTKSRSADARAASPGERGKGLARYREEVALQKVAPELDEHVAFSHRLHPFGDDDDRQLVAERDERA